MASTFDALVVGLHLRWDGVWQRPNHLLSRFAHTVPVVIVEEPAVGRTRVDTVERTGGVTVIRPQRPVWTDTIDDGAIATARAALGSLRPLIWLYTPQMLALADAFPDAPVIFDRMDDLTRFKDADPRIAAREDALLARAAVVFAGGRTLHEAIRERAPHARCYPSGVEVEHFAAARRLRAPGDVQALRRPVFGYVGVIDERVDLELIAALADARPDATVALVGPVAKIDPSTLPRRANIAYLGKREYAELPAILAGFDVALMPFALNDATAAISPTKTLEYLAAGLPVVSTPVRDVVADHGDVVFLGRTPDEFIAAVTEAQRQSPQRARLAEERARRASWDRIAADMWRDLERAGFTAAAAEGAPA